MRRAAQRGFLLIAAVVLIAVGAVMALALTLMVGGGGVAGGEQVASSQALFAAESGIERAFYAYSKQAAVCNGVALGFSRDVGPASYTTGAVRYAPTSTTLRAAVTDAQTVIPLTADTGYAPFGRVKIEYEQVNYARKGATAADCNPYPAPCLLGVERGAISTAAVAHAAGRTVIQDQCLVSSTGTHPGSGVTRRLDAVIGIGNLLPPSANTNFNLPYGSCSYPACQPTGWTLNPSASYTPFTDTGGPDGSRAAYALKADNGPVEVTSAGNFAFSPAITLTAPITLSMSFDYKVERIGNANTSNELSLTFVLRDSAGTAYSSTEFTSGADPATAPWRSSSVNIVITGTGAKTLTNLEFSMRMKPGQAKHSWLDNLALTSTANPTIKVQNWREDFR